MSMHNVSHIIHQLTLSSLPSSLDLIRQVSTIDWDTVSEAEIDICSDIIIRISADCIASNFDTANTQHEEYKRLFQKIAKDVMKSDLCKRSDEFDLYFKKFMKYVDEMS